METCSSRTQGGRRSRGASRRAAVKRRGSLKPKGNRRLRDLKRRSTSVQGIVFNTRHGRVPEVYEIGNKALNKHLGRRDDYSAYDVLLGDKSMTHTSQRELSSLWSKLKSGEVKLQVKPLKGGRARQRTRSRSTRRIRRRA